MARPVILIPVKPFAEGKSRLSGVLDAGRRERLARDLFVHVLDQALARRDAADVLVISRDAAALRLADAAGAQTLVETSAGHNPALAQALLALDRDQRAPVLIVSSDLPLLGPDDLLAMLQPRPDVPVLIAADRSGQGTNALYLARPTLMPLRFGARSREAHEAEAARLGLGCAVVQRSGLASDVDLPSDLQILPDRAELTWTGALQFL